MIVTEVGIVWLLLLIVSFFLNFEYSCILTIASIVLQSVSFCYNDNFTVSIFEICALLFLIRYMLAQNFRIIISRQVKLILLFCTLTTIMSIFSVYIFRGMEIPLFTEEIGSFYLDGYYNLSFSSSFFLGLVRLWLYSVIFIIIQSYFSSHNINYDAAYDAFKISFCMVSIVGIIQYLSIFDNSLYDVVKLFHSANLEKGSAFYTSYNKLYASFREPSYCGLWLSASLFALLTLRKKSPFTVVSIFVAIIEIALSYSTTAFVVLMFMSVYFLFKNKSLKQNLIYLLLMFLIATLFLGFTSEGQRWLFELSNKMTSSSGIGRLTYIMLCYEMFFATFGLGVGFHQVQCMSLIGGLLGQTGLVCTVIFLFFIFSLFLDSKKLKNRKFTTVFLLATVVGTEVSSSGLLYSAPLWYALYLWAVNYRSCVD